MLFLFSWVLQLLVGISVESHWNDIDEDTPDEELNSFLIPLSGPLARASSILFFTLNFCFQAVRTLFAPTEISRKGFSPSSNVIPLGMLVESVANMCVFDTQHIDLTADPPTCSPSNFEAVQFSTPGAYLDH